MPKVLEALTVSHIRNYPVPSRGAFCYAEESCLGASAAAIGKELEISLTVVRRFKVAHAKYFDAAKLNAKKQIARHLYAEQLQLVEEARQLAYSLNVTSELLDVLEDLELSMLYTGEK